jgi:rod shape-determining protein MreD
MNWARSLRTLIAFAILISLHFTLRPLLGWRAAADFLVIALLLASVRVRPGVAAFIGLGLGLLVDAMAPSSFGAAALAMATVGFVAAWLKAVFFADNLALNGFFFFLGKWVFDILYLVGERRVGGEELAMQLLLWSPLAAAVTAIAGVLLLVMMRPMLETSPT